MTLFVTMTWTWFKEFRSSEHQLSCVSRKEKRESKKSFCEFNYCPHFTWIHSLIFDNDVERKSEQTRASLQRIFLFLSVRRCRMECTKWKIERERKNWGKFSLCTLKGRKRERKVVTWKWISSWENHFWNFT
jgi:hypothetical protein